MLFKANQMPPVLTNSAVHMGATSSNNSINSNMPSHSNHFPIISQDIDLRSVADPRLNRNMDLDMRSLAANAGPNSNLLDPSYLRQQQQSQPRPMPVAAPFQTDPRQRADPRVKAQPSVPPQHQNPPSVIQSAQPTLPNRIPTGIPNDASDQEKAALIMQVLQLSDEQISMLPPEQRASILVLKEQIAKSTQR